ncbi:hypothetical protein CC80DRAFT_547412 [Byssothecium circinans]|uniref:Uncharacterized protein n=1 Tax=Byssothecium circinans TaxID=147558 RepID=A0A6A5TYV1_9PLEO|nr:hypothetical protein CC80DRAFT_547412 [Byssothecium circinans]
MTFSTLFVAIASLAVTRATLTDECEALGINYLNKPLLPADASNANMRKGFNRSGGGPSHKTYLPSTLACWNRGLYGCSQFALVVLELIAQIVSIWLPLHFLCGTGSLVKPVPKQINLKS